MTASVLAGTATSASPAVAGRSPTMAVGEEVVLSSPIERVSQHPLPELPATASGYLAGPSAISADGRLVALDFGFQDYTITPEKEDVQVYVRDRLTNQLTLISANADGKEARRSSRLLDLSADGRFALFTSWAANLVPEDDNGRQDVFRKNVKTGAVSMVSVSTKGVLGNRRSGIYSAGALSEDGNVAVFLSNASNLVSADTNRSTDVFVRNMRAGRTGRVNITSREMQSTGAVYSVDLSADARLVTFSSTAADLVPADADRATDVFVRNRELGRTRLVSRGWDNPQVLRDAHGGTVSASGRFVAFSATNRGRSACSTAYLFDRRRSTLRQVGAPGCEPWFWSTTVEAMSSDGRWLLVTSDASMTADEVGSPGDGDPDVFLVDRRTGSKARVSAAVPDGDDPVDYAESVSGDLTADGTLATFASAVDFVPESEPMAESVYLRDVSEALGR